MVFSPVFLVGLNGFGGACWMVQDREFWWHLGNVETLELMRKTKLMSSLFRGVQEFLFVHAWEDETHWKYPYAKENIYHPVSFGEANSRAKAKVLAIGESPDHPPWTLINSLNSSPVLFTEISTMALPWETTASPTLEAAGLERRWATCFVFDWKKKSLDTKLM